MQKQHRLAVGANSGFAVTEDAGAGFKEHVSRETDVGNLIADMVHPAAGIGLQEFRDWGIGSERVKEFDLRIGQFDKHGSHPVLRQVLWCGNFCAEQIAIGRSRRFEISNDDGDVVEASDHFYLTVLPEFHHQLPGGHPRRHLACAYRLFQ